MTVETLLDLSDRIDTLYLEFQDLRRKAITKASDFVNKEKTFWYEDNDTEPLEMVFPSYSTLRFKTNHVDDRRADLVIQPTNEDQRAIWTIDCPIMNVCQINDKVDISPGDIHANEHRIHGKNIVCTGRYMQYTSDDTYRDILSYTDPNTNQLVSIQYPIGDNAIFNDVRINEGHTLYLNDPNARIKIKKPKELV